MMLAGAFNPLQRSGVEGDTSTEVADAPNFATIAQPPRWICSQIDGLRHVASCQKIERGLTKSRG